MAVHAILAAIVLVWLVPSVGLLITSFRPRADIASSGWWTLNAARLTLENYAEVLGARGWAPRLEQYGDHRSGHPADRAGCRSRRLRIRVGRFRGRNIMFLVVISLLLVPPQILLVPVLRLSNQAGLTRILPGYLARPYRPRLASGRLSAAQFLRGLPGELVEAAKIDGANEWQVFSRVMLPLSVPGIASLTIFQFMWVWNDLLVALVLMNNPDTQPMTVRIQALLGTYAGT